MRERAVHSVMNARMSLECKCASSLANGIYFHDNYCMANNRWGILSSALNRIALHCIALHTPPDSIIFIPFFFLFIRVRLFPCHSVSVYKKLLLYVQSFRRRCFVALLSTFICSLYSRRVDRTRVYVISISMCFENINGNY